MSPHSSSSSSPSSSSPLAIVIITAGRLFAAAAALLLASQAYSTWNTRQRQRKAVEAYHKGILRSQNSQSAKLTDDLMMGTGQFLAEEMAACYAAIAKVGRGVVYFGSARFNEDHEYHKMAVDLSARIANMLQVPAWSGGGKGMMGAVTKGCASAGYAVGAIRLQREASDAPGQQPKGENPLHAASVMCGFMASRKIGLTDAGMRLKECDRTAFIFLPGGFGTIDEAMEILVLKQLKKMGTNYPIPMIFVNYDGFFRGILDFMHNAVVQGALSEKEEKEVVVCNTNDEVLAYLSSFYGVSEKTCNGSIV